MNKANQKICQSCGKCCTYVDIPGSMPSEFVEDPDTIRWLQYRNIEITKEGLRVHRECDKLIKNFGGTKFFCGTYTIRPHACRNFTCELIRGKI